MHEKYYEESLDWNLTKLLPKNLRIEKVNAFKVTRPRIIGDIGLRAFFQLYKRAKQLIKTEGFDFVYIPIPSFYCALLGRWLHSSTGIKYGIDYIDPWVHSFPGSDKIFSRHWLSSKIARLLEPIAVKKASLVTGVAEGYYEEVLKRNPHLKTQAVFGAMPYGSEKADHDKLHTLNIKPYLFNKKPGKIQLVYAGALLPKAYGPLEAIFKAINNHPDIFSDVEFHFIGTGSKVKDPDSNNVKQLALQYNLWQTVVFEYAQRIPYLDVLVHLEAADAVFILGSTEPHYTPSKTYQGVLSKKPILAVLHAQSTAADIIRSIHAGKVLSFDGEEGVEEIKNNFSEFFKAFLSFKLSYNQEKIDTVLFNQYSAKEVTKTLVQLLEHAVSSNL